MRTQDAVHRSNRKKGKGAASSSFENAARLETNAQQTQDGSMAARGRDELTAISGIDSTTEMALNSLGIHRYEDFERWTPEQLADGLTRRGVSISSGSIMQQNWIGQGQALARKSPTLSSATPEMIDTTKNEITQHAETQARSEVTPAPPQLATPPVSEKIDQKREEKVNEKIDEKIKLQSVLDEAAVLQIKSARFAQQSATAGIGRSNEKGLRSEIVCELAATKLTSKKAEPMTLCTQIHAIELTTGFSELLASRSQAVSQTKEKYQSTIDFETPHTGRYRLQIVALLLGAQPNLALHQGPILRVEG